MIIIPENTEISQEFRDFIEFFNSLEQDLEWPVCEGKSEARQILKFNDSRFRGMIDQMAWQKTFEKVKIPIVPMQSIPKNQCPTCGLDISGITAYSCSNKNCPCMGQVWC